MYLAKIWSLSLTIDDIDLLVLIIHDERLE